MSLPIFALDVDVLVTGELPGRNKFWRWSAKRIVPNTDAEFLCIQLRKTANVALLSRHEFEVNAELKKILEGACYNWLIPVRVKDEFELFRDVYFPYKIVSNIPGSCWQGEYADVFSWTTWQSAFDLVREDVPLRF